VAVGGVVDDIVVVHAGGRGLWRPAARHGLGVVAGQRDPAVENVVQGLVAREDVERGRPELVGHQDPAGVVLDGVGENLRLPDRHQVKPLTTVAGDVAGGCAFAGGMRRLTTL